ncbi:MAG: hypothetical protein RMM98_12195 [Acidobacteriota bacterium]|nr:hypothetical protein [Blastocatellia bacterium]MDW8240370.1 hypothetical protein [Acidobacteriota bacterium]
MERGGKPAGRDAALAKIKSGIAHAFPARHEKILFFREVRVFRVFRGLFVSWAILRGLSHTRCTGCHQRTIGVKREICGYFKGAAWAALVGIVLLLFTPSG